MKLLILKPDNLPTVDGYYWVSTYKGATIVKAQALDDGSVWINMIGTDRIIELSYFKDRNWSDRIPEVLLEPPARCRIAYCVEPVLIPNLCYDHALLCDRCNQPYDPENEHVCIAGKND